MTITEQQSSSSTPLLLPTNPARFGPVTRFLLARLAVALVVVQLIAAYLILVADSQAAHAMGTSLVFPGMGFMYNAMPVYFFITVLFSLIALVLWWGASAHLAIPLVWLASVLLSGVTSNSAKIFVSADTTWDWATPLAYVLAFGGVAFTLIQNEREFRQKRSRIPELNSYLAEANIPSRKKTFRSPDDMDIELLRWCYAVAFQPDDGLIGLDYGEQFHSGTQLRYQLNSLSWALSVYAANYVPNAQGQIEHALAKIIEKHTDLRVWKYWRTLNILGNFSTNPDPIAKDNIMFSAFLGDAINIYEAATGSTRFDTPGSLTFVWKDGTTFEYDHHSIAAAVQRNFEESRLGFYPCEPGWSFTVCNVMGAQSLFGHDTLHGTKMWPAVKPRWVNALDNEYATPDGTYAHIRSSVVGLSWDTGEVPGGHYLAAGSHRFADILPDYARRAHLIERRNSEKKIRALASAVVDGKLNMTLPLTLERSRARRSALAAWNGIIGGARMFGEEELADAALQATIDQCGTGQRWPDRPLDAGMQAFGGHMMIRWSTPLSAGDLNVRGYVPPVGPVLAHTNWDAIIISEARSSDGVSLTLQLEPLEGVVPELRLEFSQLSPNTTYMVHGAFLTFESDAQGQGSASLSNLHQRMALTVTPQGQP